MSLKDLSDELEKKRAIAKQMGGEERIAKQHGRNKLTARERIDKLFDEGTFLEIGIHGTQMMGARPTPADGCITGYGKIGGRPAGVVAYDFTVLGGSIGEVGERKATRIREIALKERFPIVWLIDSAGARISPQDHVHGDQVSLFSGSGYLFKEQVLMSGVVPQVAAMVGPGAAGTAYIPGLADFVPMVKGTSSMALGGPPLVKAVVGEEISEEDLGGSKVHNEISGVADLEVESDDACLAAVKTYLSYFPAHSGAAPDRSPFAGDPLALLDEKILSIVPDSPRQGYDMKKLVRALVDDGSFFEMKPKWAKNLVTGLARIGGFSVGIVANNPMFLGGALDVNSADKAARFVWLCDAFNIPLLFLADTPGFLIGSKVEQAGIIRHGAKMLFAVSEATVPKITVVVRKSYGAGYYVMCGRAYDPDLIVAWPTGEVSVMGAEGMAGIATKKMAEGVTPEQADAARKQIVEAIKPLINIYKVAGWAMIDDVIDPRETRKKVFQALELTRNKTVERPPRKHGVLPV